MFPYPYYYYGSADSTDVDVIIAIPKSDMPEHQEDRKRMVKRLVVEHGLDWNATLVVIEDGYLVDTIYPKAWVDGLNNALWQTYALHEQDFPNPLQGELKRNRLLSIYKTARTVLTTLTRTHYRPIVRPILKGVHDFELKLEALDKIDFCTVSDFNQKNTSDIDLWKALAFYLGQNLSLIQDDCQIYTKKALVQHYPELHSFIYRKPLTEQSIQMLNTYLKKWLAMVNDFGEFRSEAGILSCGEECIDMRNEVFPVSR